MLLVYTGDRKADAEAGANELLWFMRTLAEPQQKNPPGYATIGLNIQALRGAYSGRTEAMRGQGLEYQREQDVIMYRTPDSVARQIRRFYELVGGYDHLLVMQQAGHLNHERTVASMKRFAQNVYPQIRDLPRAKPLAKTHIF